MRRRDLLRGVALTALVPGCLVASRPPPAIEHVRYPLGPLPSKRVARGSLLVGAASIDITPPAGSRTWLAGYGFQRQMKAIRDRVEARCLYFDDGVDRVALVVADVVGLLLPTVERVRRLVGNGIEVAVVSTHNHQSPDTMGYWGPAILHSVPHRTGIDVRYQRVFERRLAAVVAKAVKQARPATLAVARADVPEGLVRNLRTPGEYDREVHVVEARAASDGAAIATFVNFGCHPETLGDRSRRMSADFPGQLRAKLEQHLGGTAVFANGALGGMITADIDREEDERTREALMIRIGDSLAETAIRALRESKPIDVARIRYRREQIELPGDNALFKYVERVGLVEPRKRGPAGGLLTEVGRIELGPISWALIPGEPTPQVGLRIKKTLGIDAVIALANDELGYVLDPAEFDDEKFAYEVTVSVGRETAPRIEAALAKL